MHLSKVNEALDHKIVGGSEYQWNCWPNARFLDYETDYAYASVVFNTQNQEVYLAEVNDKDDSVKPYRWLNPMYKQDFINESKLRNVDHIQAWDNVSWYDLETPDDWLKKANAIMNGQSFDTRIEVPIDLDNDTLMQLMLEAHKKDITLNQMVEEALKALIQKHEQEKIHNE
jgi:hypothetical protein